MGYLSQNTNEDSVSSSKLILAGQMNLRAEDNLEVSKLIKKTSSANNFEGPDDPLESPI